MERIVKHWDRLPREVHFVIWFSGHGITQSKAGLDDLGSLLIALFL